jgi:restriction system protein
VSSSLSFASTRASRGIGISAAANGPHPIDLIDGDQLCDLLKQLKLGVRTEMVEKMTVEPSWFTGL